VRLFSTTVKAAPQQWAASPAKMCVEPFMAKELAWVGLDTVSLSNSHAQDCGPQEMFSTMRALEEPRSIHAGVGRDLDEAREPRYLEIEKEESHF